MIVIADVQPTPKELRPTLAAWPGLRWWSCAVLCWLAVIVLITVSITWGRSGPMATWIPVVQLAGLYGVFGINLFIYGVVMKTTRRAPASRPPTTWQLDEDGVTLTTAIAESRLDWRAVVRVAEEKDRLILAVTPYNNPVLPLRLLSPDQRQAIRDLVETVRASGRLGRGVD